MRQRTSLSILIRNYLGLLLFALPCLVQGETRERWYVLLLSGQPSGWSHETVTFGTERIISVVETELSLMRGISDLITLSIVSTFAETPDGRALDAKIIQNFGHQRLEKTYVFDNEKVAMKIVQQGRETHQSLPFPKQAFLPPAATQRYIKQQLEQGEKQIEVWTVEATAGIEPIHLKLDVGEIQNVEVFGRIIPARKTLVEMSQMPELSNTEYIDAEGEVVRARMELIPGLELEVLAADKQLALAQIEPPELMAATLLRPNYTIDNPRTVRSATFELRFKPLNNSASQPLVLPQSGFQRVEWRDPHTARVKVDVNEPVVASDKDLPTRDHLSASSTLDITDPLIHRLTQEALGEEGEHLPTPEKAEHLRRFVHRFVAYKDLSVGFATASEVARSAQGDCTEHAVLLAAMLKAAGIPSRLVSGLIYIEDQFLGQQDVFGYHMWAQAWIDDESGARWLDVDATLSEAFDATHIALTVNTMADGEELNDMIRLSRMIGRISIDIISSDHRD